MKKKKNPQPLLTVCRLCISKYSFIQQSHNNTNLSWAWDSNLYDFRMDYLTWHSEACLRHAPLSSNWKEIKDSWLLSFTTSLPLELWFVRNLSRLTVQLAVTSRNTNPKHAVDKASISFEQVLSPPTFNPKNVHQVTNPGHTFSKAQCHGHPA